MSSSSTITEDEAPALPPHPGEILREEYLPDFALTAQALADALGIELAAVEALLSEGAAVTPETALRLGRVFNQTPQFWMNLQVRYDLVVAERRAANDLERVRPIAAA